MNKLVFVAILATLCFTGQAAIHAVLTAGSDGYGNYRHQADVCHAYQILINGGVPADNIIVLAYDDIANNRRNPFPGQIFNKPSSGPGVDVYAGCKIDYTGRDVNKQIYHAVLTGDKTTVQGKGTGRVLESGSQDTVFINFVDHGNSGLIAFPSGGYLYAPEFNEILTTMHQKNMYKELTYYLETCYSGSMFVKTPTDIGVYGVSAANTHESSWAAYCSPNNVVDGKSVRSCLGDLFSVNWMENADAVNTNKETLQQQFVKVRDETTRSQVMQWGDLSFTSQPIAAFLGGENQKSFGFLAKIENIFKNQLDKSEKLGLMDNYDVETQYLADLFKEEPSQENFHALAENLRQTKKFAAAFESFQAKYPVPHHNSVDTDFDCYRSMIDKLEAQCGKVNEYSQRYIQQLYNFCGALKYTNYSVNNTHFDC